MTQLTEAQEAIVKALGLEGQRIQRLTLDLRPSKWPTVHVVVEVPPERLGDLGVRLNEYVLVTKEAADAIQAR